MKDRFSLEGKTILVTGASSGIGRCVAVECSKKGAKLVINGRNPERLEQTLSLLEGNNHLMLPADLSEGGAVEEMVAQLPLLDGVSHNAGISQIGMIKFMQESDWREIAQTNAFSAIWLTHCLVAKKKLKRPASIVFTSSIGRYMVAPGNSMYAASKGGLSSFMKGAALELAVKGIRCNAILPGMVETGMMKGKESISPEQWELNKQQYPLKRFGSPEEIAWLAVYLFSDASAFMTGSELVIDGGRSLR